MAARKKIVEVAPADAAPAEFRKSDLYLAAYIIAS